MTASTPAERWNHDIHYHPLVLRSVPAGARTALDVGAGDGLPAHGLRERIPRVIGLDVDGAVLDRARAEDDRVERVEGDVMTAPLPLGAFDVVASIATLHHLPDADAALRRLADLTAASGVLVVPARARSTGRPAAPLRHRATRRVARRALPGARWTRLALWRYAIVWTRSRAAE